MFTSALPLRSVYGTKSLFEHVSKIIKTRGEKICERLVCIQMFQQAWSARRVESHRIVALQQDVNSKLVKSCFIKNVKNSNHQAKSIELCRNIASRKEEEKFKK